MSNINEDLQQNIDLVAEEIARMSGARVLASASGIADGLEFSDQLYAHCVPRAPLLRTPRGGMSAFTAHSMSAEGADAKKCCLSKTFRF